MLPVLGPQNDIVTHRLAPPHKDVDAAIETVRALKSEQPAVKLAFKVLVLMAARSGWRGGMKLTPPARYGRSRPHG